MTFNDWFLIVWLAPAALLWLITFITTIGYRDHNGTKYEDYSQKMPVTFGDFCANVLLPLIPALNFIFLAMCCGKCREHWHKLHFQHILPGVRNVK